MHIPSLFHCLRTGERSVVLVADHAERLRAYTALMQMINRVAPLLVSSHCPTDIQAVTGGQIRFVTEAEVLGQIGSLALLPIPAGRFWMGSDTRYSDEAPLHQRESAGFAMMRVPITVQQYQVAIDLGVVMAPPPTNGVSWQEHLQHPRHPAVAMTLEEAETVAWWLSGLIHQPLRVPTEAEWEYAARGTDQREYPTGETEDVFWANVPPLGTLVDVGQLVGGASPFGISSLIGQVGAWTSSRYCSYTGPTPDHLPPWVVVRGGPGRHMTTTYRTDTDPQRRSAYVGMRLVCG